MSSVAKLQALPFLKQLKEAPDPAHPAEEVSSPDAFQKSFFDSSPLSDWALLKGRLTEMSGDSALSMAMHFVKEAQCHGEPVAFITDLEHVFFPPDLVQNGIDVNALVVALLSDGNEKVRAADQLARSGAFGLIVVDLAHQPRVTPALMSRLLGLAQKHDTAILFLSAPQTSLGALVSLRVEASLSRRRRDEYVCEVRAIKDKKRAPGWKHHEGFRGPTGLH